MKKILALVLAVLMVLTIAGCSNKKVDDKKSEGVMTWAEYDAAALDSEVVIETYVQDAQSWWNDSITLYTQDSEGGYFIYNAVCSSEMAEKLTAGQKIRVTGTKTEWAGEVEVAEGATIEVLDGFYAAEPMDATKLLGTDDLIKHQNKLVAFKDMTVEASKDAEGNEKAFLYGWDGSGMEGSDSDLYFNASVGGNTYTFVIEYYLCNENTDAYKAVQNLKVGDKIDMTGFLYWYEGAQPHITEVIVK